MMIHDTYDDDDILLLLLLLSCMMMMMMMLSILLLCINDIDDRWSVLMDGLSSDVLFC